MNNDIKNRDFSTELEIKASRSSGPGGQNVNKVNTRIELKFDIVNSIILSDKEKNLILKRLNRRLQNSRILSVTSQSYRSQLRNKKDAISKFYDIIENALKPRKRRIKTSPTKGSVEKRLKRKSEQSEKKSLRISKKIPPNQNYEFS